MAFNTPIEVQRQPRHRGPRFCFHNYADPAQAAAVEAAQARVVAARNRVSQFARPPLLPLTQAEQAALLG